MAERLSAGSRRDHDDRVRAIVALLFDEEVRLVAEREITAFFHVREAVAAVTRAAEGPRIRQVTPAAGSGVSAIS